MITATRKQCITMLLLSFFIHTHGQDRAQDHNSSRSNKTASRAQDHNSSRSNKTASLAQTDDWNSSRSNKSRSQVQSDDWTFGINSGASFAIRSNEDNLFRGNSIATKMFGRYHFGNIGLGFSSGIVPGTINNSTVNEFMVERKLNQGQPQIARSNPFNSYFLFGPSFRFGNRIVINAEIQGGMFINNPGSVTIGQAGAVRPLYRFEGGGKNLFPGFSGNISLAYPINNSTRFFINTDYLQSKSSINLYDPQRGIDLATEQNRNVKLATVGIGITKSFGAKKGIESRRKHIGNVKYENISITEDAATGEKIIVTTQQHAINTKGTGATNGRMMSNENCGPVTQKITNPDGTVEEKTFACPADAVQYNERISMNVTVPKQTQGATFGEKVNAGLHAAGSALSQGTSRGVISGTVSWGASNSSGIITNQEAVSSVGNLAGSGGGAAAASYAATGIIVQPSTSPQGIAATIYAREAGSGMATGKRSARDNASGMATGKRQYEPVFNEGEINTCTDCTVTVKLIGHELTHTVQQAQGQVQNNPLYNDNGHQGTNPMFEGKSNLRTGGDNDCDGIAGLTVLLLDADNGAVIATTKTTTCGDFFFANVPSATYRVKVAGGFSQTKSYNVNINSEGKMDMAGELTAADDHWTIQMNTGNGNAQKTGISTSRSNIRNRNITIVETDLDGNGEFELTKCVMEFTDGSSRDVTAYSKINLTAGVKKVTVRGWNPEKKQESATATNTVTEYTINIADGDNGLALTGQYENGTKKETRVMSKVSRHPNVVQWIIPIGDTDADEAAASVVKTRTKSNNSNDRMINTDLNADNSSSQSYTKNLPVLIGDIDNDGISEILTGNSFGATNNSGKNKGASLLGGALPGGAVISSALAMPGTPIGGIIVKGGRNPGGSFRTTQTNEHGEFEFKGMEKGNYLISTELNYYIDDETVVTVNDDDNDGVTNRKGWDGTVKGGSKINAEENIVQSNNKSGAQDHNSSRSNKTASIADNNPGDGTTAKSIVNTTKSNTKDFLVSLDELDHLLNADKTASTAAIRITKENSRLLRNSIHELENRLQNTGNIEKAANETDTNFAILLGSVNKLGQRYSSISNVLKTKHDTAKNSVGNIR